MLFAFISIEIGLQPTINSQTANSQLRYANVFRILLLIDDWVLYFSFLMFAYLNLVRYAIMSDCAMCMWLSFEGIHFDFVYVKRVWRRHSPISEYSSIYQIYGQGFQGNATIANELANCC